MQGRYTTFIRLMFYVHKNQIVIIVMECSFRSSLNWVYSVCLGLSVTTLKMITGNLRKKELLLAAIPIKYLSTLVPVLGLCISSVPINLFSGS